MDSKKRLFIVSFGDSDRYKVEFDDYSTNPYEHPSPRAAVEKELNDYLKKKFPGKTFAYYTTPKVTEVSWEHRDRYADYKPLTMDAIESIKKILEEEVENMKYQKHLDNNAPYAVMNPDAV